MSLGGYGTMDFVNAYPEKIAAAIAFCGGCLSSKPDGLGKTCLWIMHATADTSVDIKCSQQVVSYLQSKGKDKLLRYDWMQGGSHSVYASYFYLQKTYDGLFSHSLRDKPRQVNRTLNITGEETSNAYTTSWGTQPTNVVREETVPTTTKSTTTTVKKRKEKREKRTTGRTWRNWWKVQK